jgi:hypothetical protein
LSPAEFPHRANATPFAIDELSRLLDSCQRARYAPLERVPDEEAFRATLADAQRVMLS